MKVRRRKDPIVGAFDGLAKTLSLDPGPDFGEEGDILPDGTVTPATAARVAEARRFRIEAARIDVNEFCAYVGRDAETGESIEQAEIHETFHDLADSKRRLILMAFPESGKTTQLAILRTLFKLGHNPNLRVAVVSEEEDLATNITRAIRSYIEKSGELAEVFPNLIRGEKWEEDAFTVRRSVHSRDPSVKAYGLESSLAGSRIDILILDDVLSAKNTLNPERRKHILRRIRAGFIDRLSKEAVVIFLCNAWHPEDAAHVLEKEGGWHVARFSVEETDEGGNPTGELTWEEKWDRDRIDKFWEDMGPIEAARALFCRARDDGESPFSLEAMKRAQERARELGIDLVYSLTPEETGGAPIYCGVDLAVTKKDGSHLTAFVPVLLWPEDMSRQVLWCEAGRWSSAEIRDRFLDIDRRYPNVVFIVENNAAQRWIIDIVYNQSDLPPEERRLPMIVPFTTGKNKAHPQFGVEGLAVEIDADKWLIPVTGPAAAVKQVKEMCGEALYYTRGGHTGDRLMSQWFAREGCRKGARAGRPDKETTRDLDHPGVRVYDGGDEIGMVPDSR